MEEVVWDMLGAIWTCAWLGWRIFGDIVAGGV